MIVWIFGYMSLCGHSFISLGYIPRSRILGHKHKFMFNFSWFSSCFKVAVHFTLLPTMYKGSPFSISSLILAILFIIFIAILMYVKQYVIVVLIYISLITNDIDHLSIYLLVIIVSFLVRYLFKSFAYFFIGFLCCYSESTLSALQFENNSF